jgi:hypothetical protein
MEIIQRDIKIYKFERDNGTCSYALGQERESGYIISGVSIGNMITCSAYNTLNTDLLPIGEQINIDLQLLKRKGMLLTIDNKIIFKAEDILIDLKQRMIFKFIIGEEYEYDSFRTNLMIKNS